MGEKRRNIKLNDLTVSTKLWPIWAKRGKKYIEKVDRITPERIKQNDEMKALQREFKLIEKRSYLKSKIRCTGI